LIFLQSCVEKLLQWPGLEPTILEKVFTQVPLTSWTWG